MQEGSKARKVATGIHDFEKLITNKYFYVDKTKFIKEWWENGDEVTLINRPRRFGKTLNLDMVKKFFSIEYAKSRCFDGLFIWKEEGYQNLQGTYPVISLSFSNAKERSYQEMRWGICQLIAGLYDDNRFLLDSGLLGKNEKEFFQRVSVGMNDSDAAASLRNLSKFLSRYYQKPAIILLDEYDTPVQEAYVNGFLDEMLAFTRSFFTSTFKDNPYMERALMAGITRISRESMFSGLNNLEVVTAASGLYEDSFGFTEPEVFAALDEFHLSGWKEDVKFWYDGYRFGDCRDIYNPWSILGFLKHKQLKPYWANTGSNSLAGKLLQEGSRELKMDFEQLMKGEPIAARIDEDTVFAQLERRQGAVWGLLLSGGYLKVLDAWGETYRLAITNYEVKKMFGNMILDWFGKAEYSYNNFVDALLKDDLEGMNRFINEVSMATFSYFDTGGFEPERFYHGFVLGLLAELGGEYALVSNRESGIGRYDVLIEPLGRVDGSKKNAIIMEFKVCGSAEEGALLKTAKAALRQIEEKQYEASLAAKGFPKSSLRKYGFAFAGKRVLIARADG
ncbi:AAA family ATPase [Lachnospiraceae bacterium JLR.KK009]